MSKPVSLRAEIQNLTEILKSYGYNMPELEFLDTPKTLKLLLHGITRGVLRRVLGFEKVIADIRVMELISRLSGMDASEKLISVRAQLVAEPEDDRIFGTMMVFFNSKDDVERMLSCIGSQ